jgi:hypothetical protein
MLLLCTAKHDLSHILWAGAILRIKDQWLEVWRPFWPARAMISIPLRAVRSVEESVFGWYLPLPSLTIGYVDEGTSHRKIRLLPYWNRRSVFRYLQTSCGPKVEFWERPRLGSLSVWCLVVVAVSVALVALGVRRWIAADVLVGGVLLNNLAYRAWLVHQVAQSNGDNTTC